MPQLKILICGGGIGGPALAFWLARSGHKVKIVERWNALRASGAQIDLREQGIEAVERMGLVEEIRSKLVDEKGVSFVNEKNEPQATILANTSGKGAQSLTSEFEIMRGDLVRILYQHTAADVDYVFGVTVESFNQYDGGVSVSFSDGTTEEFDILVGADGQGSRIRKAILPSGTPEPLRRLGLYISYWIVPREEIDTNIRKTYLGGKGRLIMERSHNDHETQAYFFLRDDSEEAKSVPRASVEEQKNFWAQRFGDAGWQTPRFLKGMERAEDFYCQEVIQVQSKTWYQGRIVLLGDAAYCPSPLSGMGTTSAIVGAYILAGEISRNSQDLTSAFQNYDDTMRPFVDEVQKIPVSLLPWVIPDTQTGVRIVRWIAWLVCLLQIPALIARFSSKEKGGWVLPDYGDVRKPSKS